MGTDAIAISKRSEMFQCDIFGLLAGACWQPAASQPAGWTKLQWTAPRWSPTFRGAQTSAERRLIAISFANDAYENPSLFLDTLTP